MKKICFGLIGSGWRAQFYIRIAKALPDRFELAAVLVRDKEKGDAFSAKFQIPVVNSLDALLEKKSGVCCACHQEGRCYGLPDHLVGKGDSGTFRDTSGRG